MTVNLGIERKNSQRCFGWILYSRIEVHRGPSSVDGGCDFVFIDEGGKAFIEEIFACVGQEMLLVHVCGMLMGGIGCSSISFHESLPEANMKARSKGFLHNIYN